MASLSEVKKVLVVAEDGRIHTCPLDLLKGPKGDDAILPSTDYFKSLIIPLIPDPIQGDPGDPGAPGETPTAEFLKSLIIPLIPEPLQGDPGDPGAPGETPTDEHISALITKQMPTRAQVCDMLIPYIPLPLKGDPGESARIEDVLKQLPPFPTEEDIKKLIVELLPKPGPPVEGLPPLPTTRRAHRILGFDAKGKLGWLAPVIGGTGRSLIHEKRLTALEQGGVGGGSGGGGTWGSIIGTLSDQTDLQAELDGLQAQIASVGGSASQNTFLVSGGQVVWVSQYQFLVSAATYYIGGVLFNSAQQTIILDAAHTSLDRIDVIAVNISGTVVNITGTAASEPSEPDTDPGTQLKLSLVFVGANTTQPGLVGTEYVYTELTSSGDWTWATSGAGWTLAASTDPRSGTFHIEASGVAANAYVEATRPASETIDPALFDFLVFNIKSTSQWANNRGLQITLRLNGVLKGAAVAIQRDGTFGFNSQLTSIYQQVAIPVALFSVPPGVLINQVRATVFGGAINFRADDIAFIGGASIQSGTFLTQDQADVRYGARFVQRMVSDPNGFAVSLGDGQDFFVIPPAFNGWRMTDASMHLTTAGTTPTNVQLAKVPLATGQPTVDLLTTKLSVDANEKDSSTAAVLRVINTSNAIFATGDEVRVDVDLAGTNAKGLVTNYTFERVIG